MKALRTPLSCFAFCLLAFLAFVLHRLPHDSRHQHPAVLRPARPCPQQERVAAAAGSETTGEEARWHIVSDLKRIADLAGKAGVRIAAEFHVGTLNDTNTWASQLLLEVNHPNFYSYWQPLSGMSDEVCIEGLTALSPHLAHVHVFQWRTPQDRQPLAEGAERWTNFLHLAASAPGDRYAMLEFVQGDAPENFMRDAAVLRELLAATEHSL